ncbi:MAG: 30S ribosomal protein S6--L-glutamate ligase [Hyperthermus sp.]|nr:MAG: 30S ribosomal protein S6--L-glutamate ligase [Hyperthermus sp.]
MGFKLAILHSTPRPSWSSVQLLNAAVREGVEGHYILWDYIAVRNSEECRVLYQDRCFPFDAVIVRGLGRGLTLDRFLYRYSVLKALEEDGVVVVNPADSIFLARNKLLSLLQLKSCNIPVPYTFATENPAHAIRFAENEEVVVKPIMGSLGLGSFRVKGIDAAYHVINFLAQLGQPIYMQRYVEKKGNRDIRVMVVGGRVIAAIYRYAGEGEWKTNIARGGRPRPAHIGLEVEDIAVKATSCLKLVYSGVDIIESTNGKLYVVEVNASPLWRGLLKATGINPAIHIVRETVLLAINKREARKIRKI